MARMSKGEVELLLRHARRQEQVATERVKSYSAARKAEFEAKVATSFSSEDEDWADIVHEAKRMVDLANQHVADRCRERGFPQAWAPQLGIGWLSRGETAMKARRDELRKVAYSKIDEMEKAALAVVRERMVAYEGHILAGHLESAEAQLALANMPDLEQLIPALDPAEVQQSLPIPGPSY